MTRHDPLPNYSWKMALYYFTTLLYHCILMHCTIIYYIILYCIVMFLTTVSSNILYCIVMYCTILYSTILYSNGMYCFLCTVLKCTLLFSTQLYFTLLICIVLKYTLHSCTVLRCSHVHFTFHWKHRENRNTLPFEHCIGCQCVRWVILVGLVQCVTRGNFFWGIFCLSLNV